MMARGTFSMKLAWEREAMKRGSLAPSLESEVSPMILLGSVSIYSIITYSPIDIE